MMMTPRSFPDPSQSGGFERFTIPKFAKNELIAPSGDKICVIPMAPTNGGKINGTRIADVKMTFPGNSNRLASKDSGMAINRERTVLPTPMRSEFHNPSRYSGLSSTSLRYAVVKCPSCPTNASFTVEKIGKIKKTAMNKMVAA